MTSKKCQNILTDWRLELSKKKPPCIMMAFNEKHLLNSPGQLLCMQFSNSVPLLATFMHKFQHKHLSTSTSCTISKSFGRICTSPSLPAPLHNQLHLLLPPSQTSFSLDASLHCCFLKFEKRHSNFFLFNYEVNLCKLFRFVCDVGWTWLTPPRQA